VGLSGHQPKRLRPRRRICPLACYEHLDHRRAVPFRHRHAERPHGLRMVSTPARGHARRGQGADAAPCAPNATAAKGPTTDTGIAPTSARTGCRSTRTIRSTGGSGVGWATRSARRPHVASPLAKGRGATARIRLASLSLELLDLRGGCSEGYEGMCLALVVTLLEALLVTFVPLRDIVPALALVADHRRDDSTPRRGQKREIAATPLRLVELTGPIAGSRPRERGLMPRYGRWSRRETAPFGAVCRWLRWEAHPRLTLCCERGVELHSAPSRTAARAQANGTHAATSRRRAPRFSFWGSNAQSLTRN
jgi:hypothetical protein